MSEIIFGDKKIFAIRYVPGYSVKESGTHFYAYLHFILAEQVLGDENESCYLLTWLHSVKQLSDRIKNHFDSFKNKEFINRSDSEIFEIVRKANQSEEEYNPKYLHLPVIENSIWNSCFISIDETTNAWLITLTEENGNLKFI